jgi:hypothetical protein
MDDDRALGTAGPQMLRQFRNNPDVIAVFARTNHHPVQLAIADQGRKSAHALSPVLTPTLAKGIALRSRGTAVVYP